MLNNTAYAGLFGSDMKKKTFKIESKSKTFGIRVCNVNISYIIPIMFLYGTLPYCNATSFKECIKT